MRANTFMPAKNVVLCQNQKKEIAVSIVLTERLLALLFNKARIVVEFLISQPLYPKFLIPIFKKMSRATKESKIQMNNFEKNAFILAQTCWLPTICILIGSASLTLA